MHPNNDQHAKDTTSYAEATPLYQYSNDVEANAYVKPMQHLERLP